MKKIIILLFVGIMVVFLLGNNNKVLIPENAIRFRIIANSNSLKDQEQKLTIKNDLEKDLIDITTKASNINEARLLINNSIPDIENKISKYTTDYNIIFGNNYFPEKVYKGVTYKSGNYESLVITLGDGLGDNWWCVLFPPLCLLEAKEEELDEINYSFYVNEILNKF